MIRPSPHPRTTPIARTPARRGFTLVELLIVIVIIGILIALLFPVLASSIRKANESRVSAEINNLATALSEFKNTYGDYPPSRIMLSEVGYYPVSATGASLGSIAWYGNVQPTFGSPDISLGQLAERSVRYLRKFFPKATFSTTVNPFYGPGSPNAGTGLWHDFNGNGFPDAAPIYLEGDECLVFFLGGIPNQASQAGPVSGLIGFGTNPQNPFMGQASFIPPQMQSVNRKNPSSFEFRADRLVDLVPPPQLGDGDGMPGYLDALGRNDVNVHHNYVYFSSYGGDSYDPNDANFPPPPDPRTETDDQNNYIAIPFWTIFFPNSVIQSPTVSPSPNPYTATLPVPAGTRASFLNAKGFQIISSGADGRFGPGGQYSLSSQGDKLPGNGMPLDWIKFERDNISNFSNGRLD